MILVGIYGFQEIVKLFSGVVVLYDLCWDPLKNNMMHDHPSNDCIKQLKAIEEFKKFIHDQEAEKLQALNQIVELKEQLHSKQKEIDDLNVTINTLTEEVGKQDIRTLPAKSTVKEPQGKDVVKEAGLALPVEKQKIPYKGVRCRRPGRWTAEVRVRKGPRVWLGTFESAEAAARAYDKAAIEIMGQTAELNFACSANAALRQTSASVKDRPKRTIKKPVS
ncbi:hypothetical protein RJ639_019689 [Escallonia herrerae]|uniref:AP2/ERF domain-containing protein n=1 Tax=Escallonia herrerae TaxID=1293975 RepID=A0AA89AIH9_9ASTE|nr:hypothetical protein RJ639_019689 [Escallonia herrerae]